MTLRIEDYALIGDTQTAALVGANGSIDWLCLPRFDSPACFAALLGTTANGFWEIAPAGEMRRTTRRYRGSTLVLETEFETADGAVRVVDCMPSRTSHARLVRVVEGALDGGTLEDNPSGVGKAVEQYLLALRKEEALKGKGHQEPVVVRHDNVAYIIGARDPFEVCAFEGLRLPLRWPSGRR